MGVSSFIPLFDFVGYTIDFFSFIVGAIVSAIAAIIATRLLPTWIKEFLIFQSKRIIRSVRPGIQYELMISAKYEPIDEEDAVLEDISQRLQSVLEVSPDNNHNFTISEENSMQSLQVRLRYSLSDITRGETLQQTQTVNAIEIRTELTPSYKNLKTQLYDARDRQVSVGEKVASVGFSRKEFSITCHLSSKPLILHFMDKISVSRLSGTTEEGAESVFFDNKIRVRGSESVPISGIVEHIYKLIVYYA